MTAQKKASQKPLTVELSSQEIWTAKRAAKQLTLEEKIAHGGHPVLRWIMDNIFVRTDPAGNIKPDKEKSSEKIDGAVATIMALDRALRNDSVSPGSVYDERGILFLWKKYWCMDILFPVFIKLGNNLTRLVTEKFPSLY